MPGFDMIWLFLFLLKNRNIRTSNPSIKRDKNKQPIAVFKNARKFSLEMPNIAAIIKPIVAKNKVPN